MRPMHNVRLPKAIGILIAMALSTQVLAAGPKVVSGPGAEAACFKPEAATPNTSSGLPNPARIESLS